MSRTLTTIESPWKTTKEISEYLRTSRQTLNRHIARFNYGHHYYRVDPSNNKSKILWHQKRVEEYFCTPVVPVSYNREVIVRRQEELSLA